MANTYENALGKSRGVESGKWITNIRICLRCEERVSEPLVTDKERSGRQVTRLGRIAAWGPPRRFYNVPYHPDPLAAQVYQVSSLGIARSPRI